MGGLLVGGRYEGTVVGLEGSGGGKLWAAERGANGGGGFWGTVSLGSISIKSTTGRGTEGFDEEYTIWRGPIGLRRESGGAQGPAVRGASN